MTDQKQEQQPCNIEQEVNKDNLEPVLINEEQNNEAADLQQSQSVQKEKQIFQNKAGYTSKTYYQKKNVNNPTIPQLNLSLQIPTKQTSFRNYKHYDISSPSIGKYYTSRYSGNGGVTSRNHTMGLNLSSRRSFSRFSSSAAMVVAMQQQNSPTSGRKGGLGTLRQTADQHSPRAAATFSRRLSTMRNSPSAIISVKDDASISHSQAIIQQSRVQRMQSIGPEMPNTDTTQSHQQIYSSAIPAANNSGSPQISKLANAASDIENDHQRKQTHNNRDQQQQQAALHLLQQIGGDQTSLLMRDEVVNQLRLQLEQERKKHREMKEMFDNTLNNMENQNRNVSSIETTTKAVDEILKSSGVIGQKALQEELEKKTQTIDSLKQKEADQTSTIEHLEKKLLHADMKTKEAQAKEQILQLQYESSERQMKFELEKLRQQVKDMKSNEEQLKSDHAQKVIELNDQIEEVRIKQANEDEERFMSQISEIKMTHNREKETLIEQKFAATKELQMMKLDHSELIRNTSFEEQRQLVETITGLQAQVQHLTILLNEAKKNHAEKETKLNKEKTELDQRISNLSNSLEKANVQKEKVEKEMAEQEKMFQQKLNKATFEKERVCSGQMEKIHENLVILKEQIESTNQSIADQSIIGFSNPESSLIVRAGANHGALSPDRVTQRHHRGDAISVSSPQVPSAFGRLIAEQRNKRLHSPLPVIESQNKRREKSTGGEHRPSISLTVSEMQDMRQMIATNNPPAEQSKIKPYQSMNILIPNTGENQTQEQALFQEQMMAANNVNNQTIGLQNQTSIILDKDQAFQDYYVEYLMLHKLQSLTTNFSCQICQQVFTFARFFDEYHSECLNKIGAPNVTEIAQRLSQVGQESIDELKEARAMLAPIEGQNSSPKIKQNLENDLCAAGIISSKPNQKRQSSHNYKKQRCSSSQFSLQSMMKQIAGVMVAGSLQIPQRTSVQKRFTSQENLESYQHSRSSSQLQPSEIAGFNASMIEADGGETGLNAAVAAAYADSIPMRRNTVANPNFSSAMASSQHKANQMQLEAYTQKFKEYQKQIGEIQQELQQSKAENDALIFDLRESKTKVAVLEEKKAQLQIELANLRKIQMTQLQQSKSNNNKIQQSQQQVAVLPNSTAKINQKRSSRGLNVIVEQKRFGVLGIGGKSNISVKVHQPIQTNQVQYTISSSAQNQDDDTGSQIIRQPKTPRVHRANDQFYDTPSHNSAVKDHISFTQRRGSMLNVNNNMISTSPQTPRLIPLSQKFSAFPVSEFKPGAQAQHYQQSLHQKQISHQFSKQSKIQQQQIYNLVDEDQKSMVSASAGSDHQARSCKNLTQQMLNSSVHNLRVCDRESAGGAIIQEADVCYEQSMQEESKQSQVEGTRNSAALIVEGDGKASPPWASSGCQTPSAILQLQKQRSEIDANFALESENDEVDADETDGGVIGGVAQSCRRENNMIKLTHSTQKQKMIKLNNPYDEVTIVRQKQQIMSEQKGRIQVVGCKTPQLLMPKSKKGTGAQATNFSPSMVTQATPQRSAAAAAVASSAMKVKPKRKQTSEKQMIEPRKMVQPNQQLQKQQHQQR